jgi:hypothetical protein
LLENPYVNLPSFLYKYRYFDSKRFYSTLFEEGKLFCSSPQNFNDPFDCVVRIDYSSPSESDIFKKFYRMEKYLHPDWPEPQILASVNMLINNFDKTPLNNKEEIKSKILNHIYTYVGIYSLSAEPNNLLLWSHYSDSHKGFLIEFNALYLKNFLVNTYLRQDHKHLLFEVEYSDTYKLISAYSDNFDEELRKALLTKSTNWIYEKEWRILYYKGANQYIEIPAEILPDIICSVVVGSKISNDNESKIKSILKNVNIPLRKAYQSENKFELIYKDI